MTDFWQGFISAIALIAVSIIIAAWCSARRLERKRQQAVDAIIAKVAGDYPATQVRDPRTPHMAPYSKRPH